MSPTAFTLILISVFLHAGWNFISKKSVPSLAFYAISCGTAALLWFFPFIFSEFRCASMPREFWYLLLFSIMFEIFYVGGLAYAYRKSDISLVYPMVRALPLLFTAVVSELFNLGTNRLSVPAIIGMLVIFIGCLMMPLKNFKEFKLSAYINHTIFLILFAAIGITGYTVLDSVALQKVVEIYQQKSIMLTMSYLFMIELGISLGALFLVLFNKNEISELKRMVKSRSISPFLTGVFSSSAYVLVLLSMSFVTNVSYIQAFRQLSLPIGVMMGIFILKEKSSAPKIIGTATIVAGLITVALAS